MSKACELAGKREEQVLATNSATGYAKMNKIVLKTILFLIALIFCALISCKESGQRINNVANEQDNNDVHDGANVKVYSPGASSFFSNSFTFDIVQAGYYHHHNSYNEDEVIIIFATEESDIQRPVSLQTTSDRFSLIYLRVPKEVFETGEAQGELLELTEGYFYHSWANGGPSLDIKQFNIVYENEHLSLVMHYHFVNDRYRSSRQPDSFVYEGPIQQVQEYTKHIWQELRGYSESTTVSSADSPPVYTDGYGNVVKIEIGRASCRERV
jgi:hypothetical protein